MLELCFDNIQSIVGDNYDLVTIKKCKLYHGSPKLRYIQDYIKNNSEEIKWYLKQVKTESYHFDDETLDKIAFRLDKYTQWIPTDTTHPFEMYSKEVLIISLIKLIRERIIGSKFPLISKVISQSILTKSEIWQEWFKITVIRWILEIETQHQSTNVSVKYLSVMREPIQFFGNLDTATRYAKGNQAFIYSYVLTSTVKLLNLSDFRTVNALRETVFSSIEQYTINVLTLHTENNDEQISCQLIQNLIIPYDKEYEEWSHRFRNEKNKDHRKLLWQLSYGSCYDYGDNFYNLYSKRIEVNQNKLLNHNYQKSAWRRFLKVILNDVQRDQNSIYNFLCDRFKVTCLLSLYEVLLRKYPVLSDANSGSFGDLIDGVYWQEIEKEYYENIQKIKVICLTFLDVLKGQFGSRDRFDELSLKFVERIKNFGYGSFDFCKRLAKIWDELYAIPICSPYGVFTCSFWKYFSNRQTEIKERISNYTTDALLSYIIIENTEIVIDGWYSQYPSDEVALFDPEIKGYSELIDSSLEANYEY
jgi:hypothetical protein